jgi:hypothetical protein
MGCRIIAGRDEQGTGRDVAVFYDSVTNTAFGPIMPSVDDAERFIEWLDTRLMVNCDPRSFMPSVLANMWANFQRQQGEI